MTDATPNPTPDTPALGFDEAHARGEHTATWRFRTPETVANTTLTSYYQVEEAVKGSSLVRRLNEATRDTVGKLSVRARTTSVEVVAWKKEDFNSAMLLLKTVVGSTTPEEFAAEVAAAVEKQNRLRAARGRAEGILNVASSARGYISEEVRNRADEVFASEIAAMREQYETLAAKYREECERRAQAMLDDASEFAALDDPALVQAETQALVARKPFKFRGPTIPGAGPSPLLGMTDSGDPGYAKALEELTEKLAADNSSKCGEDE